MISRTKILLIAEKDPLGNLISQELGNEGFDTAVMETWGKIEPILDELRLNKYSVLIFTNTCLSPKEIPQLVFLSKKNKPYIKVLVLSGYATVEFAVDLKKNGVEEFLTLPYETNELVAAIRRLLGEPKT